MLILYIYISYVFNLLRVNEKVTNESFFKTLIKGVLNAVPFYQEFIKTSKEFKIFSFFYFIENQTLRPFFLTTSQLLMLIGNLNENFHQSQ